MRPLLVSALAVVGSLAASGFEEEALPLEKHAVRYDTPAMVWDEALPLGNGLLGALVWGDGRPLKISLDRTDLWDLRPVPEFESPDYSYSKMRQWVSEGRIEDLHKLYEEPYGNAGPTKIPAGRIEITLPEHIAFQSAELSLASPAASVAFTPNDQIRVTVHATEPVGLIEIRSGTFEAALVAPPFSGTVTDPAGPGKISPGDLASLGYPAPVETSGPEWRAFTQEGWQGFRFAAYLAWKPDQLPQGRRRQPRPVWRAAWSIATSKEGSDPLALAKGRVERALGNGWEGLQASHFNWWWLSYWQKASIEIPNATLERQWHLETYKFGAAARRGSPPISLQGPWTADDGKLPPWKGDYHHDLNTELSYWPCYSGNHLEEGLSFLDWLWDTRENCVAWTRRFFDKPGMNVPMTSDLNNNQIGGWHQYTHSSTTAAWLAHHFYMHWRYSLDREFLRDRAYPYLKEVATFLASVTEKGPDGKRTLPLSSSPEIHDNRLEAWFKNITNYDLALIRWTFEKAAELAEELALPMEANQWRELLAEMPELALDPSDGRLLVAKDTPLETSHRHHSHLMAIHPLGLIHWDGGEGMRKTLISALEEMDRLGTSQWCGYSFSWKGSLAARARDAARAEKALEIFSAAFCQRNSFHANGDQSGKGYSSFTYRPFTLEGNFAAAAGIQEMLLQSWQGKIRVFPAVPDRWKEARFKTLRAEGAFLVSAERVGGKTARVEIISEKGGLCLLENPFPGEEIQLAGLGENALAREGETLTLTFTPGGQAILTPKERKP